MGAPLVVVGSANADVYIEVERIPAPGETVGGETGAVLPGGKGANQAACAAKLGYPTYFVGQVLPFSGQLTGIRAYRTHACVTLHLDTPSPLCLGLDGERVSVLLL